MSIDLIPAPVEAFAEAHPVLVHNALLGLGGIVVIAAGIGVLRYSYRKVFGG